MTAAFAAVLRRSLGIDGPLALAAAVHIFVGMIEAPLLIRPYLMGLQRGELFATMTCGMAGVAGTVMVIYGAVLNPVVPNALATIIVASVISTPAALAVGALMVPWARPERGRAAAMTREDEAVSSLDALVRGTAAGVGPLVGITTTLAGDGRAGRAGQRRARPCCPAAGRCSHCSPTRCGRWCG